MFAIPLYSFLKTKVDKPLTHCKIGKASTKSEKKTTKQEKKGSKSQKVNHEAKTERSKEKQKKTIDVHLSQKEYAQWI